MFENPPKRLRSFVRPPDAADRCALLLRKILERGVTQHDICARQFSFERWPREGILVNEPPAVWIRIVGQHQRVACDLERERLVFKTGQRLNQIIVSLVHRPTGWQKTAKTCKARN